jgi:hypothetical protein
MTDPRSTDDQTDRVQELRELLRNHVFKHAGSDLQQKPLAALVTLVVERQGFAA